MTKISHINWHNNLDDNKHIQSVIKACFIICDHQTSRLDMGLHENWEKKVMTGSVHSTSI